MLNIQKKALAGGILLLEMSGRITLGPDCNQIESEVDELLRAQQTKIIFDLTHVKYMDSTGVGALVMSSNKLKNAGGQLRLAGTDGAINVLKLTQTNAIVPTYDSVDEAMAAFASG